MLYFASDIHGAYDLFMELLRKISFSPRDEMIICGDIIDKGPDSVRLAKFVFEQPNMRCILGNHEYAFLKFYWSLMQNASDNFDEILEKLRGYFPNDGHLLDWETVDAFEAMPTYIEERDFICVHAGLPLDGEGYPLPLRDAEVEQLVNDRWFKEPNVLPKGNRCILFGHTPTSYISGVEKILRYPRVERPRGIWDYHKIHLDMGTMTSGVVACLCADTGEEFYVKR